MKNETPTPETDAKLGNPGFYSCATVPASFSRQLERERNEWMEKYIQQNKDLGCEMMDPNGTIWDHAKKLQREIDRLKSFLTRRLGCVTISRNGYVEGLERELDELRETIRETIMENDAPSGR